MRRMQRLKVMFVMVLSVAFSVNSFAENPATQGTEKSAKDRDSSIVAIYHGDSAPEYRVYNALLTDIFTHEETDQEVVDDARQLVWAALNTSPTRDYAGGLFLLSPDHPNFLPKEKTNPVADYMFSQKRSFETESKRLYPTLLCPKDRARPRGNAVYTMMRAASAMNNSNMQQQYRDLLDEFGDDISERIQRWVASSKKGYTSIERDIEEVHKKGGVDADAFLSEMCSWYDAARFDVN